MDYNITGRADFKNDAQIITKHLHHPGTESSIPLNLTSEQSIAAKELVVSCIAGYKGFRPYPPEPHPTITIPGLIENKPCGTKEVFNFNPYRFIESGTITLHSSAFFEITISIKGCLYTCNKGRGRITPNEAIGFAMQDPSKQAVIVLDEGAFDALNDYIVAAGGPDFRSLPFSMEAIKQLPEAMQPIILSKIFNSTKALSQTPTKALPTADALADFLADAVASDIEFDPKQLKQLAQYMLESGWEKPV